MDSGDDFDLFDSDYQDDESTSQSLAELQEDADTDEPFAVERILAERQRQGQVEYLIKWENFPLLRSTWEFQEALVGIGLISKSLIDLWKIEKFQQKQGTKAPFDVDAFHRALKEIQELEKGRRNLRRWKRQLKGVVQAINSTKVE